MFGRMDGRNKASILNNRRKRNGRIVDTIVANHFEMLVGDMDNKPLNKVNGGNSFDNEFIIFVPVVMEGNMRTRVRIDARSGNNGSAEIASNVFGRDRRVTVVGLSVNVETVAMILIDSRFNFLEGRPNFVMEPVEQSSTERVA